MPASPDLPPPATAQAAPQPTPDLGLCEAYADASLSGHDASWAAVVYERGQLLRIAFGAGPARSVGEAERRAVALAVDLLSELGQRAVIYSDSREAVSAAGALAGRPSVAAVRWIPRDQNLAADALSRMGRQAWQEARGRRRAPAPGTRAAPAAMPAVPAGAERGPAPRNLERAIVALALEGGVPAAELAGRLWARWPDLLAVRGRPESSVRDALSSLVHRGEVQIVGGAGGVLAPGSGVAQAPGRVPIDLAGAAGDDGRLRAPAREALRAALRREGGAVLVVDAGDSGAPVRPERLRQAARALGGAGRGWRILGRGERSVAVLRAGLAEPSAVAGLLERLGMPEVAPPPRAVQAWPWLSRRLVALDPSSVPAPPDVVVYPLDVRPGAAAERPLWLRARLGPEGRALARLRGEARRGVLAHRRALEVRLGAEGADRRALGLPEALRSVRGPLGTRLVCLTEARELLYLDSALVRLAIDSGALEGVALAGRTFVTARSVAACQGERSRLAAGLGEQRLSTFQAAALLAVAPARVAALLGAEGQAPPWGAPHYRRADVDAVRQSLFGPAAAGTSRK